MPDENGQKPTQISPQQELVLHALLCGSTITAAAEAHQVSRQTVHEWQSQPAFAAEYERGRLRIRAEFEHRLSVVTGKALTTVEKAINDGDVQTALALLKLAQGIGINVNARMSGSLETSKHGGVQVYLPDNGRGKNGIRIVEDDDWYGNKERLQEATVRDVLNAMEGDEEFEEFARWKVLRDAERKQQNDGNGQTDSQGNGEHH